MTESTWLVDDPPAPDDAAPVAPPPGPPGLHGDGPAGAPCPACRQAAGTVTCTGAGIIGGLQALGAYVNRIYAPCPEGLAGERACQLCVDCAALQDGGCPKQQMEAQRLTGGETESPIVRERRRRGLF